MKILNVTFLAASLALFAGCNSLDNPLGNWFHGRDQRVYNPQTGEWEYPNKKGTPAPQKAAGVASALSATPAPQAAGSSSSGAAPAPTPAHSASAPMSAESAPAPVPMATPPPPRPSKATGFYNTQTGKIEWREGGAVASATPAAGTRTKHWWWPF
jgi:hypothetical protein